MSMAKRASVEDRLKELERLGESLDEAGAGERLRRYLADRANVVAARAARLVTRLPDDDFVPDLVGAFRRFMVNPASTDKGCLAKLAVVEALLAADYSDLDVFRSGIRHVQLEPTWGGQVDTAAPLRGLCGLGLVQVGSSDVLDDLAVLLADPEADARVGAARALSACGAAATPLLRFKVLTGDEQPLVLAECLSGLMAAAPDESFDFVAALIDPEQPRIAEHAAMALAESRLPGAFEFLKEKWEESVASELRESLLLPIAMTRREEAPDLLISMLGSGDLGTASAAIAALAIYRGDPGVRARAEEAVSGPHRGRLMALLGRVFG